MISELCIFDLSSAHVQTVLNVDRLIEAPNWSPCGTYLLVNGDGRLFRAPLDAPELRPVHTDGFHKCNNDHGFSPDGRTIAFTDKTITGESCIYTVSTTGGAARRLTPNVPSYWHGWSPDGKTLAYVGRRDGAYDIFTCPAGGGAETQLTHGFDHCDGPDFTPDGAWIWFNGERDGSVDLWRMHPDGSDLQRMTDDTRVNWFPHPSPQADHVLFLSYAPGTRYHPRDQDVELRLMSARGGASRVLLELYGGQGTVNVPCWSPCGTRFAFVRYGRVA